MRQRSFIVSLAIAVTVVPVARAQEEEPYVVPRTDWGDPDFQGVWETEFLTPLRRPPGFPNLVASPEQAEALVARIRGGIGNVKAIDPDFFIRDIRKLAKVRGEYRTSLIIDPPDGQLPFSDTGLELHARVVERNETQFDRASQRPMVERCMESFGYPPMRAFPLYIPRQIFQNRDHLVILTEDAAGLRIVPIGAEPVPDALQSIEGYSSARWEGDTLVIETTNLRDDDPSRVSIGRFPLHSSHTHFEERLTRVSDDELVYRVTVTDGELYTRPWTAEFSMTRGDGPIYEYACHEGNYSLPNSLSGGRYHDTQEAAAKSGE